MDDYYGCVIVEPKLLDHYGDDDDEDEESVGKSAQQLS